MSGGPLTSDMSMFGNQQETGAPGITAALAAADAGVDLSKYMVRIQRFTIGADTYADISMLENLWTAGLDPKEDGILILENKQFTNHDEMIVVVTFLESRTKTVNWRIGADDSGPKLPTVEESV